MALIRSASAVSLTSSGQDPRTDLPVGNGARENSLSVVEGNPRNQVVLHTPRREGATGASLATESHSAPGSLDPHG